MWDKFKTVHEIIWLQNRRASTWERAYERALVSVWQTEGPLGFGSAHEWSAMSLGSKSGRQTQNGCGQAIKGVCTLRGLSPAPMGETPWPWVSTSSTLARLSPAWSRQSFDNHTDILQINPLQEAGAYLGWYRDKSMTGLTCNHLYMHTYIHNLKSPITLTWMSVCWGGEPECWEENQRENMHTLCRKKFNLENSFCEVSSLSNLVI